MKKMIMMTKMKRWLENFDLLFRLLRASCLAQDEDGEFDDDEDEDEEEEAPPPKGGNKKQGK
jgi:hypothetical protein